MSPQPSPEFLRHPSLLRLPGAAGPGTGDPGVAFAAQDDVWLAPLPGRAGDGDDGGPATRAWRLTDDRAPVAGVRASPDGRWVAYTSTVDGAPEVHLAAADGAEPPRRLTWWGDPFTQLLGWTADGRLVAASAVGEPFRSRTWARVVPLDGGPAERLPFGPVTGAAWSPSGAVAVTTGSGRRDYAWWKRYRGGTASRVWLDADGAGQFVPLPAGIGPAGTPRTPDTPNRSPLSGQVVSPMWVGDRLVVVSDSQGHGNVYSLLPSGGAPDAAVPWDLRRHTDVGADGAADPFWPRHASSDGQRVVYAAGGRLWVLDDLAADSAPRPLAITTGGPRSSRRPAPLPAADVARDLDVAVPLGDGRQVIAGVRGTVHLLAAQHGPALALQSASSVRARLPRPLGPHHVVWVSDADGEDGLDVVEVPDPSAAAVAAPPATAAPRRLASGRLGRVLDLAGAPDGSAVAVATHDGRLVVVDVATGADRQLATTPEDAARDLAWSPDAKWLAWTSPGPEPLSSVRLARVADGLVVDATGGRFADTEPVFTADGKHLAFLSRRTFDPVYDAHAFELSFPVATRPHLLPLAAGTAAPFSPRPGGRPLGDDAAASAAPALAHDQAEVVVDVEDLPDRVIALPVPAGWLEGLRAVDGGLVWRRVAQHGELGDALVDPDGDPPPAVLERFDLRRGTTTQLVDAATAAEPTSDGKRLLVRSGTGERPLRLVPSDRALDDVDAAVAAGDAVVVDLAHVRVVVDPRAQWRQMFDEAGRLMRDAFWVPDMAGVGWDGVLERYRPLLDAVSTHDELVDVLWEVAGELGTSHAYVMPKPRSVPAERRLGFLGADVVRDESGAAGDGRPRWRVARVLPPETSDARARSPLAAPGVGVSAGDALLAVDGRAVDPVTGPGPLLVGTGGRPVELLIEPADSGDGGDGGAGGGARAVVVVPLTDVSHDRALRYHDWVAGRRAAVHASTGGRAGYLHVPDMVSSGWAQLHRDLRTELDREALVLDVRDNSGGHTSQLVVERLARRVLGWDVGRGYPPMTYPDDARRGPLVCVTDENAGSDGDIVTAVVKQLGLGPVVGARTWGGVIGIDGRFDLVDGTGVTQPRYAFWFPGVGWGVENHGVDPDVPVARAPHDHAAGRDPQLDVAVGLLLEALERDGSAQPPDPATRPSRTPPPLPPRPGVLR